MLSNTSDKLRKNSSFMYWPSASCRQIFRRGIELYVGKRLLLFAILAATITYQAGLTPPSGFRLKDDESGHHAGDPVLHYNFPRRYKAFFYCNSVSFMLSIALILLLVNKNLYRPAIRSNALSVCTAAGMFSLVGAYAAGSTQRLKTSIYIFALAAVILIVVAGLVVVFWWINKKSGPQVQPQTSSGNADEEGGSREQTGTEQPDAKKKSHAKRKYLMLLGIVVASVTYQAGLEPPGGVWQSDGTSYIAGNPVVHENRRPRYLAFFYSNSISFVAYVVVIILLLLESLHQKKEKLWPFRVMNMTIALDLLDLLVAYTVGSSRSWKTTGYVFALVIAVLAYIGIHVMSIVTQERRWRPLPFPLPPLGLHPPPAPCRRLPGSGGHLPPLPLHQSAGIPLPFPGGRAVCADGPLQGATLERLESHLQCRRFLLVAVSGTELS
ncbi:hypothetical protein PR202_ga03539 [Eleusine coracana subsp. coracana]|uniref:PGG domain-containing protein n=1 Tax=Eleusine coracana subsp. coracana TaxID=191504 RepID=A0AAV5BNP3_ELECO|nr:hypothetical protein PR202_ga03539 [Eleusine coracana subsp. coracana]